MTDILTPAERSRRMAAIRGRDTGPERTVRRLLRALGIRYRTQIRGLPGTPDFVIPSARLALFVHGCFWHRHSCRQGRTRPRTRAAFWRAKLAANAARDRRVQRALRAAGWRVAVIWQCRLSDVERVARRLARLVGASHTSGRGSNGGGPFSPIRRPKRTADRSSDRTRL